MMMMAPAAPAPAPAPADRSAPSSEELHSPLAPLPLDVVATHVLGFVGEEELPKLALVSRPFRRLVHSPRSRAHWAPVTRAALEPRFRLLARARGLVSVDTGVNRRPLRFLGERAARGTEGRLVKVAHRSFPGRAYALREARPADAESGLPYFILRELQFHRLGPPCANVMRARALMLRDRRLISFFDYAPRSLETVLYPPLAPAHRASERAAGGAAGPPSLPMEEEENTNASLLSDASAPLPVSAARAAASQHRLDYLAGSALPWRTARRILYHVLRGLDACHACGLSHRNLKPKHVQLIGATPALASADGPVDAEGRGRIPAAELDAAVAAISDFALARSGFLDPGSDRTPRCTSLWYRAPETMLGVVYDEKVDVWAAACIMSEMLTGRVAFPGNCEVDQLFRIFASLGTPDAATIEAMGPPPYVFAFPKWPSERAVERAVPVLRPDSPDFRGCDEERDALRDLLERMWSVNPAARVSAAQALAHPFFAPVRQQLEAELRQVELAREAERAADEACLGGGGLVRDAAEDRLRLQERRDLPDVRARRVAFLTDLEKKVGAMGAQADPCSAPEPAPGSAWSPSSPGVKPAPAAPLQQLDRLRLPTALRKFFVCLSEAGAGGGGRRAGAAGADAENVPVNPGGAAAPTAAPPQSFARWTPLDRHRVGESMLAYGAVYHMEPRVLQLASELLDRFLSRASNFDRKHALVLSATCVCIASKLHGPAYASIDELLTSENLAAYDPSEVMALEELIVNALGCTVDVPTPADFFAEGGSGAEEGEGGDEGGGGGQGGGEGHGEALREVRSLARALAQFRVVSSGLCTVRPSSFAAACALLAAWFVRIRPPHARVAAPLLADVAWTRRALAKLVDGVDWSAPAVWRDVARAGEAVAQAWRTARGLPASPLGGMLARALRELGNPDAEAFADHFTAMSCDVREWKGLLERVEGVMRVEGALP